MFYQGKGLYKMKETIEQIERNLMVREQIESRGIKNPALLAVMKQVPRHLFVPPEIRHLAYTDHALLSYCGQTISQPFIVAKMTELLALTPTQKVLEIGTGTGYQTAILAALSHEVYTMELIPDLCDLAQENLAPYHYDNIHFICGNGYNGYPDGAPYDAIIVTAAPSRVPEKLLEQLAPGGRMVIPVGVSYQTLFCISKGLNGEISETPIFSVVFIPMRH